MTLWTLVTNVLLLEEQNVFILCVIRGDDITTSVERICCELDNMALVCSRDKHLSLRHLVQAGSWAHKQPKLCLPGSVYSGANDRSVNLAIQL